jgi:gamma-glutamylputrescine oxidase
MVGKMLAQTLTSYDSNFRLFEKIRHHNFPGFGLVDTPLLVLAMSYFKLKDYLGLK